MLCYKLDISREVEMPYSHIKSTELLFWKYNFSTITKDDQLKTQQKQHYGLI